MHLNKNQASYTEEARRAAQSIDSIAEFAILYSTNISKTSTIRRPETNSNAALRQGQTMMIRSSVTSRIRIRISLFSGTKPIYMQAYKSKTGCKYEYSF